MMAVTRLTGSEAVRAVLANQLEPLCSLAEEVEGRLVDWEWEVAGLVRERLRLAMLGRTEHGREQAWAEHRLELYYTVDIYILGIIPDRGAWVLKAFLKAIFGVKEGLESFTDENYMQPSLIMIV